MQILDGTSGEMLALYRGEISDKPRMGFCLAVGDINDDGYDDVATGANGWNHSNEILPHDEEGRVFVFFNRSD